MDESHRLLTAIGFELPKTIEYILLFNQQCRCRAIFILAGNAKTTFAKKTSFVSIEAIPRCATGEWWWSRIGIGSHQITVLSSTYFSVQYSGLSRLLQPLGRSPEVLLRPNCCPRVRIAPCFRFPGIRIACPEVQIEIICPACQASAYLT